MLSRRSSARDSARGQALVEFALVAPVMLVIMLLAVDFGRLFFTYVAVNNAAREGAFYAATHASDWDYNQTSVRVQRGSRGCRPRRTSRAREARAP